MALVEQSRIEHEPAQLPAIPASSVGFFRQHFVNWITLVRCSFPFSGHLYRTAVPDSRASV
jgi:hypothetical protein